MTGLAVGLLVAYGLVAFGLRVLIQVVRTGSTGLPRLGRRTDPAERIGGMLLVGGITLSVIGAEGGVGRIAALDGVGAHVAGAVLCVAGILVTFGSQLAMGTNWRVGVHPDEPTGLVTGGPFAIVRNPIYAGMIPFFVGIALLVPCALTIAGAVVVLVALEIQTRLVEEPHLMRAHARAYAHYAARVGRFVPRLGRLR
jgi:protein-S-isoprenylcysteine O-methyltransferase Ste14